MSRIIRLQAEGFKRLVAVDITPDPHLVRVGGNNEQGKTSVLDAIFAAIGGADAAPIKPVRTGEEYAIIKVDIGDNVDAIELKATRYFEADGFDSLKLENADGANYGAAQTKLNDLVGSITFDPLAFANMDDRAQVAELLRLVPLEVDLAALRKADKEDYDARRDVNRDAAGLKSRFEAIAVHADLPDKAPDRAALVAQLGKAAETNSAIDRTRVAREEEARGATNEAREAESLRERAAEARKEAERLDALALEYDARATETRERLAKLPALAEPVDTSALQRSIDEADAIHVKVAARDERARLATEFETLRKTSEAFTTAMATREEQRQAALAAAKMPIKGLSLATIEEELRVTFNGEPFSQSSGAQRIRVSTALAIAANPKLRVCRIKDGSLLDKANLAVLADMAKKHDFQIWLETVGEEGGGVIMQAGKVKGAPEPERIEPPKRRRKAEEGDAADEEAAEGSRAASAAGPGEVAQSARRETADPPAEKRKPRAGAMAEIKTPTPGQLDL